MRTIHFRIFFTGLLMTGLVQALPVHATGEAAKQTIENFVQSIRAMEFPAADPAKNQALIKQANAALDIETMGKKALGSHWETASPENQKAFTELFWKLIENVAYPRSNNFMGDFEITYPDIVADANGFEVHSVIKQQEQALDAAVVYHVSPEGKVDDVILDGVSIIEDLKFQFDKIIAESQFSGLLDKMRERLAQAEKENTGTDPRP